MNTNSQFSASTHPASESGLELPARQLEAAAQVGHTDAAPAFDPVIDRHAAAGLSGVNGLDGATACHCEPKRPRMIRPQSPKSMICASGTSPGAS